jgi:hypothetical protein
VAELSLLRALWLQREVHRALRWRQREAATLLARSAVENCILGLYCLRAEQPLQELRGENAHQAARMFEYLKDVGLVNDVIVDCLRAEAAQQDVGRRLPPLIAMARQVSEVSTDSLTTDLYKRLYIPLSTLFTHANGLALLRHVPKKHVKIKPAYPWAKRSAARTADACVGVLAAEIAGPTHVAFGYLRKYGLDHSRRVVPPLPAMVGRQAATTLKLRLVPRLLRQIVVGYMYFRSSEGAAASHEARVAHLRHTMEEVIANFGLDMSDTAQNCIMDQLILILARPTSAEPMGEPADNGADSP